MTLRPGQPISRFSQIALLVVAAALSASTSRPARAQSPSKDFLFQEQRFSRACKSPLKYAAGACVRRCPAGYEDMGRTCRQRGMRGGGGW